jgi:hypothetical protein
MHKETNATLTVNIIKRNENPASKCFEQFDYQFLTNFRLNDE